MVVSLLTCRPPVDERPGTGSLKLIIAQGQSIRNVYVWEDTARRQVRFDFQYFDQNQFYTRPPDTPQLLVNGQPLAGNTYTFPQPGQYVFSARVGNQSSDNEITLSVSRAVDYIRELTIRVPIPLLNADSVSRLPLTYEVVTKDGNRLEPTEYGTPQLWADAQPTAEPAYFATRQPDTHRLQASLWGVSSNTLSVTARPLIAYPLVRLPVVIHLPLELERFQLDPASILNAVNQYYRRALAAKDPNQADAYIEFYPAPNDPDGQPLAVAGLHPISATNPGTADEAQRLISKFLNKWCPRQYINVFVGIDWYRQYPAGYSYAYMPSPLPPGSTLPGCEELATAGWESPPAIYLTPLYPNDYVSILGHELGHFLGLGHTFSPSCNALPSQTDIPQHLEAWPDQKGLKYSCQQVAFVSDYVMDYYIRRASFTQDQVKLMRLLLERGSYLPIRETASSGRQERLGVWSGERGQIVP